VLVVEDDAALRKVLELRLTFAGFAVTAAEDGQVALDLLDRTRPHVVVCDLMMPRVDGFTFCRQARQRPGFERLPVVLLTAHQMDAEIERLLEMGDIVYMAKPFDAEALTAALRSLVGASALAG
jgi:CheY-like chemotaxis protein